MREQNVGRLVLIDQLFQRGDVAVRRIFGEQFVLCRVNFGELIARDSRGERLNTVA